MKTELELNEMILSITNKIRATHPELLTYLDEMPLTVPYVENPEIVITTLTAYYDSLAVLLDEYKNNTPNNTLPEKIEVLAIPEIKTMELDNSYQNLLLEINNFTIAYNDVGVGTIPVIFLHGFPFDKSTWKGQFDALKATNRVIAIDIRGFGQSKDENSVLSIDLFSTDLMLFMDKLKIDTAIICGLSMGGYIALNAVNKYPNRFEALILCDTQCIADSKEVKENRYKTIDQIKENNANEFNENFVKNVFHPESLIAKTEIVEHLRNIVFSNSKEISVAGLTALAERYETCSILDTISIPTLIICGREDKVTPISQSEFMNKKIKNSIFKIVDNAGHVSNLEQPEAFNLYLSNFLNSLNLLGN